MKSFIAFLKAVRFLWIALYWVSLIVLIGFYDWVTTTLISEVGFWRFVGSLFLGGLLMEHYLGVLTCSKPAGPFAIKLARPEARWSSQHLIDALETPRRELKTVHEELVRLTGQDFGLEAHCCAMAAPESKRPRFPPAGQRVRRQK